MTVAVVGGGGARAELVAGLEDLGASVATLGPDVPGGRDEARGALEALRRRLGALDGVVLASVGDAPAVRGALTDLDADMWSARVEQPLHSTLAWFQAAHGCLRSSGGTMVVLVPTLSLTGAAGFVPWSAVTEGQRALAKAAARAWGRDAITVNCVALPAALVHAMPSEQAGGGELTLDRPGLPAPALPRPDMRADVAPVVWSLLSPTWRAVTGATVAVDAGTWMTP